MPTTTTDYGKQNISWPDLGYEAGAGLHSAITASIEVLSDQINSKWSGEVTIPAAGSVQIEHNFNCALSQLLIRYRESGAELTEGNDTDFAPAEVDVNTITITNNDAVSRTIEVFVFPLFKIRGSDLEPTTSITTTGNITAQDVTVNGDLTVEGTTTTVNSDTLDVADANITVNVGGTDATAEGAGLTVEGTGASDLAQIKYSAAATSKFIVGADGSEKEIATIDDAQVITNKDIDGGTASNSNRISVPKGVDKTTLDGLTRKQGVIVFDQDKKQFLGDDGTELKTIGGGGGLVPSADIDDTFVGTIEKDNEYLVDISAGSLAVNLPIGLGDEAYKIAFNIKQVTEGNLLTVNTQSAQNIIFNGLADTSFEVGELIRVEFAWNGTDWTAKTPWYPTYVGTFEATETQAGLVKKNKVGTIYLAADEVLTTASTITDISTNGSPSNSGFKYTGLEIGEWYTLDMYGFIEVTTNASSTNFGDLYAIHNGSPIARRNQRDDSATDSVSAGNTTTATFRATATDITFNFQAGASAILRGNSGSTETFAQLIKRSDLSGTNDVGSDMSA